MLIDISDLYSRIYEEIVTEITRDEEDLATRAITAAIDEAKMYLSRFDLVKMFGQGDTAATVDSPFLKNLCVDIAVWNLVKLGNPSIQYEKTKDIYDTAIATLARIQKQNLMPDGWIYKDTTGQTAPQGSSVTFNSFAKRKNNF